MDATCCFVGMLLDSILQTLSGRVSANRRASPMLVRRENNTYDHRRFVTLQACGSVCFLGLAMRPVLTIHQCES